MTRARVLADYVAGGSTAAEFDVLDGLTATTAELNHVDGLTSTAVGINDTQTLTNKTLTSVALENASGTQNLTGTYSTERMYLNDSYTLIGDVNVTGHLALGSVADSDVVITNDSSERTITGSGTLESGDLLHKAEDSTDLTGMTGELGSTVTGGGGLRSMQVFESSGTWTWTKPSYISTIKVFVTGGGGGGGGASDSHKNGGGGGGGGTSIKVIDVSSVSSVSLTVGAGGAATSQASGSTGGSSAFGIAPATVYCTATGGAGGAYSNSLSPNSLGGVGAGGDINLNGTGASGGSASGDIDQSGSGGGSYWGGGAAGRYNGEGLVGYHGGGGSGGDHATRTGGVGGAGIVVVEEYS